MFVFIYTRTRSVRHNENESVPLPPDWSSFMALEENKAKHLNKHSTHTPTVIVVSGGFAKITTVKSSDPGLEVSSISAESLSLADHEEAEAHD